MTILLWRLIPQCIQNLLGSVGNLVNQKLLHLIYINTDLYQKLPNQRILFFAL